MIEILKQISVEKAKIDISAINYALYSIYKSETLQGEPDSPLPYENSYSVMVTTAFQAEFKRYLQEIIESGLFQTTFDVSYYPQMNVDKIEEVTSLLTDLLNRPFSVEYAIQFRPEIEKLVTELYVMSAIVGGQMAGTIIDPSSFIFDLVDKQALEALNNIGVFWIGEGATKHIVTDSVTALAKTAIEQGMGLDEAGLLFRESLLDVVSGRSEVYYQQLASVVMNRARNFARINQYSRLNITYAEWLAIPDARICERCEVLDGTVWKVESLQTVMDNVINASTIEETIEATPFVNSIDRGTNEFVLNNGGRVSTDATTEVLAQAGICPPIHGGCRCQLIVYTN